MKSIRPTSSSKYTEPLITPVLWGESHPRKHTEPAERPEHVAVMTSERRNSNN